MWKVTDGGFRPKADVSPKDRLPGYRLVNAVSPSRRSSGGKEVGRFLLSRATAFRADLIVMGAYGHSRLSEWIFGGVTRTVLREAELPVLISR